MKKPKLSMLQLQEAETQAIIRRWRGLPRGKRTATTLVEGEDRATMLRRIVYGESEALPAGVHEKVARLLMGRRIEPAPDPAPSGEDLHTKLRKALTR